MGVLGPDRVDPNPVGPAEVPETSCTLVERLLQETETSPGAVLDRVPAKLSLMQEVDLQRTGDVVGAVAVCGIRSRTDRVLHDSDVIGQDVQVRPAYGMKRLSLTH